MLNLSPKQERNAVLIFLLLFFMVAVIVVFSTVNSFGGGDHYEHYKLAHWGWKYPKLLFSHWGKPVFTLLISPFAVIGINMARIFNVLVGVLTAFFGWQLARELRLKNSWITPVFILFSTVYFSLIFAVLTEVLHSLFVVLAVLLFFRKKYIWSAVIVSFLPLIRTESIILLPVFMLAYSLKKEWKTFPFLITGFLIISLAGFPFHHGFWWLITEMPYKGNASSIYGHGELLHFVKKIKNILGVYITLFFVVGLASIIWKWIKQDKFKLTDNFFFLLLVPGIFLLFFAAHSYVWWKGIGNSLGLIRVIGAVTPLAAITAVAGIDFFDKSISQLKKPYSHLKWLLLLPVILDIKYTTKHAEYGLRKSRPQQILTRAVDYINDHGFKNHKIYYFNTFVPFLLDVDPYNPLQAQRGVPQVPEISASLTDSSIIVWDAHFGPNEGRTPLSILLNDTGLIVEKVFRPKTPFKVLGGYNYEVYIFRKKKSSGKSFLSSTLDFERKEKNFSADRAFSGKQSYHVLPSMQYVKFLDIFLAEVATKPFVFTFSMNIFLENKISEKGIVLIVSRLGDSSTSVYQVYDLSKINTHQWVNFNLSLNMKGATSKNDRLKVYIWNKKHNTFWIDNVRFELLPE